MQLDQDFTVRIKAKSNRSYSKYSKYSEYPCYVQGYSLYYIHCMYYGITASVKPFFKYSTFSPKYFRDSGIVVVLVGVSILFVCLFVGLVCWFFFKWDLTNPDWKEKKCTDFCISNFSLPSTITMCIQLGDIRCTSEAWKTSTLRNIIYCRTPIYFFRK